MSIQLHPFSFFFLILLSTVMLSCKHSPVLHVLVFCVKQISAITSILFFYFFSPPPQNLLTVHFSLTSLAIKLDQSLKVESHQEPLLHADCCQMLIEYNHFAP